MNGLDTQNNIDTMELLEQILRQCREDYINDYKIVIMHTGNKYFHRDKVIDSIQKQSASISKKLDFYLEMKAELRRIQKARGEKYPDAMNALNEEYKEWNKKYHSLDAVWEALMEMHRIERYIDNGDASMLLNMTGKDCGEVWKKEAIKQWNESALRPKKSNKRFSEEKVAEIQKLYAEGKTIREICEELDISYDAARRYTVGKVSK